MATIKDLREFCKEQDGCMGCELATVCADGIDNFSNNTDEIVDKWIREHTTKTYIDDFMEKFPHAFSLDFDFKKTVYYYYCRKQLYGGDFECKNNCENCWNQEVEE